MRRHLVALTVVALPVVALALAAALGAAHTADLAAQGKPPSSGVDIAALDRKTDACTDFYQFACGGWVAKNPVPADRQSFGRFTEVQEHNFTILRRILEAPAAEGDRRKAADYYAACMDESGIEASGLAPV